MSASETAQAAEREKDSTATGTHQQEHQQEHQQQQPQFQRLKKRKRFPHGNYTGYYSTRYGTDPAPSSDHYANTADATAADAAATPAPEPVGARDPRLGLMRRSWFEGKKCLDVGCNEGHLTLALVRSFRPRRMVGIDIDGYLVQRARRALLAEISTGADADARAAFRPLMPRSLRGAGGAGGRAQATPAVDALPGGGKVAGAGNGAAQRPRHEECAAGAGSVDTSSNGDADGDGVSVGSGGGGGNATEAAVLRGCRKVKGRDRRKGGAPEPRESAVSSKVPGSDTSSGVRNGSSVSATNRDTTTAVRRGGGAASGPAKEEERAPFGGGSNLDTVADGAAAAAAAAAAAVAAAGADPADPADARVLSGCAVSFRHEDFVTEAHGDHRYDVVCLFSVVKWMHLNGGDGAVRDVFQKAYGLLRPGGRLILEPQPWKSYRKSARQHGSAEARANVGTIMLRPPDFPALLTDEVGFRSWEAVGSPAEGVGGFAKRGVHVFLK